MDCGNCLYGCESGASDTTFEGVLLISKSNDGGAAEVKAALQVLMDRRIYHQQRIEEIRTAYSLSAWAPSAVPKARSSSFRRMETGAALIIEAQAELEKVDAVIAVYIRVLTDYADEIRNGAEKVKLMKLRFLEGLEWDDVCFQLFGGDEDYAVRHKAYLRRLFRLYDSACSDIWDRWQTTGNGLPLSSSKGIDCRIWTAGTDD